MPGLAHLLEKDGLIVRNVSPRDRRVRIPEITPKGVEVKGQVAIARDEAVSDRLAAIPASDHAKFHSMLWNIVEGV